MTHLRILIDPLNSKLPSPAAWSWHGVLSPGGTRYSGDSTPMSYVNEIFVTDLEGKRMHNAFHYGKFASSYSRPDRGTCVRTSVLGTVPLGGARDIYTQTSRQCISRAAPATCV